MFYYVLPVNGSKWIVDISSVTKKKKKDDMEVMKKLWVQSNNYSKRVH